MSKTVADASRDYRQRQRAKLERYEAALESIARDFPSPPDWETQALACQVVARQALHG